MLSRHAVWTELLGLVEQAGMKLFDIDMPASGSVKSGGALRVYIMKPEGPRERVSVEDCAQVSRLISANPSFDGLLQRFSLEVSSPGVNRRLQRPEHFADAVGEHVRLTARVEGGGTEVLSGELLSFDGSSLTMRPDNSAEPIEVPFDSVQKARVDFLFDEVERHGD